MTAENQPADESESAGEERHRCAERRHWTFEKIGGSIALGFTAIAAIGAILSAIAGFRAYDAANRAVEAAITANKLVIRPYLKITLRPETFDFIIPGGGSRGVVFRVENTG